MPPSCAVFRCCSTSCVARSPTGEAVPGTPTRLPGRRRHPRRADLRRQEDRRATVDREGLNQLLAYARPRRHHRGAHPVTGSAATFAKSSTSCTSCPNAASAYGHSQTRCPSTPLTKAWPASPSSSWLSSLRWNAPSPPSGPPTPALSPKPTTGTSSVPSHSCRQDRIRAPVERPGRFPRRDRHQDRNPRDLTAPLPHRHRSGDRHGSIRMTDTHDAPGLDRWLDDPELWPLLLKGGLTWTARHG